MKKFSSLIISTLLLILLAGCNNSENTMIGQAQYIEHGGSQLYDGKVEFGVVYIYLENQFSIGNTESYKIKDTNISKSSSVSPINTAEEFNFKEGMLCIPLNNSGVSVGDTLIFKHRYKIVGNLEVVAVDDNSYANLSSEELYKL